MSESLNHIASLLHMGATCFYNPKPAHKNIGNFRYSGRSSNCGNIYSHADFACVCRFDIICVLCYFPVVVVVVVVVVMMMMMMEVVIKTIVKNFVSALRSALSILMCETIQWLKFNVTLHICIGKMLKVCSRMVFQNVLYVGAPQCLVSGYELS